MALVSLVDAERQWFKARVGLDVTETPRSISFCHYAVLSEDDTMEVSDASIDERFMANPLVTGEPHIRLYTGTVLRDHQGRGIGTLCVLDRKEGRLTSTQLHNLELLGRQVMALIELRLTLRPLWTRRRRPDRDTPSSPWIQNSGFSDGAGTPSESMATRPLR
jgi:GAF domain-containing protein